MSVYERQRQRYLVSLGIHEVSLTGWRGRSGCRPLADPECLLFSRLVPALSRPYLRRSTP
jgi:hypothetical protein